MLPTMLAALSCAGCDVILPTPAPEPTPTMVPTPSPDFFDPAAGVTKLQPLNDATNPRMPDKFSVQRVDTGELLYVQSVDKVTGGTPAREQVVYGQGNVVRLAGIITPAPGQPGFAATISRIQKWVQGQGVEVDMEQDTRFPTDLDNRPMVQIFFTARKGQWQDNLVGQRLLLNRMLVRTGYAVVDFNSPTTIDVKPWLNDEQFAQKKGLGLWGMGIVLGQRLLPPLPANSNVVMQRVRGPQSTRPRPRRRPGSSITTQSSAPPQGTQSTQSSTTQSNTSTTTAPSGSALPPAPPASAPNTAPGAGAPGAPVNPAPGSAAARPGGKPSLASPGRASGAMIGVPFFTP